MLNQFIEKISSLISTTTTKEKSPNLLHTGDIFCVDIIDENFGKNTKEAYLVKKSFDMDKRIEENRLKTALIDDQAVLFNLIEEQFIELVDEQFIDTVITDDTKRNSLLTFILLVE